MKHGKIKVISVVLCICLLGGLLCQSGLIPVLGTALNLATSDPTKVQYKTDTSAELGTEDNPFMVLEIVPTLDQAQFGYFIPGCEPVDMTKIEVNYNTLRNVIGQISDAYTTEESDIYALYEEIPADTPYYVFPGGNNDESLERISYTARTDLADRYITTNVSGYGTWTQNTDDEQCKAKGYFQKVEDGTGNYRAEKVYWYPFQTAQIGYNQYAFVYSEEGDYVWVSSDEEAGENDLNNKVWMERNDGFYCHVVQLIHKDTFIRATLGVSSSSFQSEVITLTPELLRDHLELIDQADLIIIRTAQNTNVTSQLWNFANENGSGKLETGEMGTFAEHDLTNEETIAIMRRMGSDNPAALIMEASTMRQAGAESNTSKLTYMALQFKPAIFCELFLDQVEADSVGHDKLYYSGAKDEERKYYWDQDTFRYVQQADGSWKDIIDEMRYYSAVSTDYNVMDKIITYNGNGFDVHNMLSGDNIAQADGVYTRYTQEWYDSLGEDPDNPGSHTLLEAVEFILQQPSYTPKLRILELEPCDEYIYGSDGWEEYYQALFPWYHPKSSSEDGWLYDETLIQVTTMPTWEFIGVSSGQYSYGEMDGEGNPVVLTTESSDDLTAKYDLIIIGSKQDASNGAYGYNSYPDGVSLGSLIYTSIGGTLTDSPNKQISSVTYATNVGARYAGNDITLKKLLELEDFLKAGKPIVVDDGLCSGSTADSVDDSKVDKDSKLYDLLTYSGPGSGNLFVHGYIESSAMKTLISQNICRIMFYEEGYPIEYAYTTEDTESCKGIIKNEVYNAKTGDNTALLEYHFYIYGNAADTYNVYLNVDLDGDGVYSGSLKELSEVYNMNAAEPNVTHTADVSEQKLEMTIYDKDWNPLGTSGSYELTANTEYYATREIPSSQQGIIPWKLEVQSNTNNYLRSSAIDYTAVYNSDRESIMVLQMNLSQDMKTNPVGTIWTDESIVVKTGESYEDFETRRLMNNGTAETDNKIFVSMSDASRTTAEKFAAYLEPVQEFDVTIQYLSNTDWCTLFNDTSVSYETRLNDWERFLSNYDMLLFGFIDNCQYTENQVFAEGLKDYIAQGKSVIFSHDMVAAANQTEKYGKYTSWLRTMTGQRRAFYNRTDTGAYEKSYTKVNANGGTVDFAAEEYYTNSKYKKYFKELTEDVDGGAVDEVFYDTWVSDLADNSAYLYMRTIDKYQSYPTDRVTKDGGLYYGKGMTEAQTDYVKLTNNGQITSYPYKINDTIEVLTSHIQYFQLDLEYLDEGDVNVWFSLTDTKDPQVQEDLGVDADSSPVNLFSARDQDCRNNFFIYNKGNITYTGSGHTTDVMPDDEVKLFVNTMIAAYRQPESQPYVEVENADAAASDGTNVLYLDYDGYGYQTAETEAGTEAAAYAESAGSGTKGALDNRVTTINGQEMVGIELSVHDDGSLGQITGKKYYMKLYHKNTEDGTYTQIDPSNVILRRLLMDGDGNVTGESDDLALSGTETLSPYYEVEADGEDGVGYIMYVPYEEVADGNGLSDYSIGIYATYTKSKRFVTTGTRTTKARLMLLPLFDLS